MQDAERRTPPGVKQHLDPDVLALLALGEQAATEDEAAHLASCRACAGEMEQLAATVAVARSSQGQGEFVQPSERVWSGIRSELGLTASGAEGSGVAVLPQPDEAGRRRPLVLALAVAAATVFALLAGGTLVWQLLQGGNSRDVLAEAALEAFPGWEGAEGAAVLAEGPQGDRFVTVTLDFPADPPGYGEVWLIANDGSGLISLGVLNGSTGTFAVPAGLDIGDFSLVDVSLEPLDGDPAHSGDSIARGEFS